jgi:putative ABC transport system ATP-binding protein
LRVPVNETAPVIRLDAVTKIYPMPAGDVRALDRLSLEIRPGEFIAIMGPSGSGKSTLLNLIGCLDVPTTGEIQVGGRPVKALSDDELTVLRRDHIGFVFQQFNLIPLLTVLENVEFPLILKSRSRGDRDRCREVLRAVGLTPDLDTHRPAELSGGQQQRAAIARALVNDPEILLCDEPTGNLDSKTGDTIMALLTDLNQKGKTIIVVTHDPRIAGHAGRTIRMVDGRVA